MTHPRRALLAAPFLALPAAAQTGPLRLLVPFPAGGPTDVLARRYAARLATLLGQPVIVENRAGAAGAIGTTEAARARPDGTTLVFGTATTLAFYPTMAERPAYQPLEAFTPLGMLGSVPAAFAAKIPGPITLAEAIAQARARPGALRFGSPGTGSFLHIAMLLLLREARGAGGAGGAEMTHVPYRGSSPAMADLIGGHIDLITDTFATTIEAHRGGRIRILAIATAARSPLAPEIPTVAEALGLPSFDASLWMASGVPAATPAEITNRLAAATAQVVNDPAFRAELDAVGITNLDPLGPEGTRAYIASETARWKPVIEASGARLE